MVCNKFLPVMGSVWLRVGNCVPATDVIWINVIGAETVAGVIRSLVHNGVQKKDIVVMSPYAEQVAYVSSLVKKDRKAKDTKASTTHGMQGSERKFVILDTVRTTAPGFIDSSNLLCVAISRQKVFLVIVGNASFLLQKTVWWAKFVLFLKEKDLVVSPESMKF